MAHTLVMAYVIIFFLSIFTIVITRLVLILRLYALKDQKIFADTLEYEVILFMASMTLPINLSEEGEDTKAIRIIRILNKLKAAYWWLMFSLLIFLITMIVLEHGFGIKV